jgi:hypothetical protein
MFSADHLKRLKILHLQVGTEWSDDVGVKKDVFVYLTKARPCVPSSLSDVFVFSSSSEPLLTIA